MIRTLICDLDGPILDTSARLYACYGEIVEELGHRPLARDPYWEMKRSGASLQEQLARSGAEAIAEPFAAAWLARIERDDLLLLDLVHPEALAQLAGWKESGVTMVLATMRRNRPGALRQLDRLGIAPCFDVVWITAHDDGSSGKAAAVRTALPDVDWNAALWVGDSEIDIAAARQLGCPVWAVANGVRSAELLAEWRPSFLSPSIVDVDLAMVSEEPSGATPVQRT